MGSGVWREWPKPQSGEWLEIPRNTLVIYANVSSLKNWRQLCNSSRAGHGLARVEEPSLGGLPDGAPAEGGAVTVSHCTARRGGQRQAALLPRHRRGRRHYYSEEERRASSKGFLWRPFLSRGDTAATSVAVNEVAKGVLPG